MGTMIPEVKEKIVTSLNNRSGDSMGKVELESFEARGATLPMIYAYLGLIGELKAEAASRNWIDNFSREDDLGNNVFHYSAEGNKPEVAKFLVESLPKDVTKRLLNTQNYSFGNTPLHLSSAKGSAAFVSVFLSNGANADLPNKLEDFPIHQAAWSKNPEVLLLVIPKTKDINVQDKDQKTAVVIAAENDFYDGVEMLVAAGANVNIPDNKKKTALHYSYRYGSPEMSTCLIGAGADIEALDGLKKKPEDYLTFDFSSLIPKETNAMKKFIETQRNIHLSM